MKSHRAKVSIAKSLLLAVIFAVIGGCSDIDTSYNGMYPDAEYFQLNDEEWPIKNFIEFKKIEVTSDTIAFNVYGHFGDTVWERVEILRKPLTLDDCKNHFIHFPAIQKWISESTSNGECYLYLGGVNTGSLAEKRSDWTILPILTTAESKDEIHTNLNLFFFIWHQWSEDDGTQGYGIEAWSTHIKI